MGDDFAARTLGALEHVGSSKPVEANRSTPFGRGFAGQVGRRSLLRDHRRFHVVIDAQQLVIIVGVGVLVARRAQRIVRVVLAGAEVRVVEIFVLMVQPIVEATGRVSQILPTPA